MSDSLSPTPEVTYREHFHFKEIVHIAVITGMFMVLWEFTVTISNIPPYLLPKPTFIIDTLWQHRLHYAQASLVTLAEALAGLVLGMVVGILSALVITIWDRLERSVLVLSILIKATPMVAIAPLLIIWFGFGAVPKIIVTGLITFFPVLINVHAGFRSVDSSILELLHSLNANRLEILWHARWPSALPFLFAALKVIGPLSLVGAVVAEWAGASAGLGRSMWLAYTNLNMPSLFAAILCSAAMGISIYLFINFLEQKIIFWK
jgi:ABC-type nitrate/sulfonate/bicarbonate transport system permease component